MSQPIPFRTTRYRCPHCPRTGASKARVAVHIGRCWSNPEARGCKTCEHFFVTPNGRDGCAVGVSLDGRPECRACGGTGWAGISAGAEVPCGPKFSASHVGDGIEVKAGPIVHCEHWEIAEKGDA